MALLAGVVVVVVVSVVTGADLTVGATAMAGSTAGPAIEERKKMDADTIERAPCLACSMLKSGDSFDVMERVESRTNVVGGAWIP